MAREVRRAHGVPVEISHLFDGVDQRVYIDFDDSIDEFRIIASELSEHPRSVQWTFGQRTAAALIQLLRFHIHDAADELEEGGGDGA